VDGADAQEVEMGMVGGEENGKDILGRGSASESERRYGTVYIVA